MSENTTTYVLAAGMGIVAGMRSMSAPALLSRRLSRHTGDEHGTAAHLLDSRRTAGMLMLLAAGEMAFDKTPWVPRRTELPALAGRALAGALSGAALADRRGGSRWGAALLGAGTAAGATYLAYRLRKEAATRTDIPDAAYGLVEDAIVWAVGARLASAVA